MTWRATSSDLVEITPSQAIHLWAFNEVGVICQRPPNLEDFPDLAMRVRGALGRQLKDWPAPYAHRYDPFNRPPAYDALYEMPLGGGSDLRPAVIMADMNAELVVAQVRLFGNACIWTDVVRQALVQTMLEGVALVSGSRHRVQFEPIESMERRIYAQPPFPSPTLASVILQSPLAVRQNKGIIASGSAILRSLMTRCREIAPWFGTKIDADWQALHRVPDMLEFDMSRTYPVEISRHSQRQRDREIRMAGILGQFRISGDLEPLLPFLALAPLLHMGSHTALGFGRCDVALS